MSGTPESITLAIATFASENPLLVGLALFIATSLVIHYWRGRFYGPAVRTGFIARSWARFAAALGIAVVAAVFIRTFVAEIYSVSGASMLPGIGLGDRLLISKSAYGIKIPGVAARLGAQLPKRGDVIVFTTEDPATHATTAFVKRVIGLPGDIIAFSSGIAIINRWPVPICDAGPYVSFSKQGAVRGRVRVEFLENTAHLTIQTIGGGGFAEYTVQAGEVFVAGDDRDVSNDSRAMNEGRGGGVPLSAIRGRVTRVLVGGRPDGRLDMSRILARPGLDLHWPGIDLTKTKGWIADCLKAPPPSIPPAKVPNL
jgi:signal peptidase I